MIHVFFIGAVLNAAYGGIHQQSLLKELFERRGHDILERPVEHEEHAVIVIMNVDIQQLIDLNEKDQIITTNLWMSLSWNDYSLAWDPSEFGNISNFNIPVTNIWWPDILMYNSADERYDATFKTNVIVDNFGNVFWSPPGIFASTCEVDITWFPFDEQQCKLKFGSWSHTGDQLNLLNENEIGIMTSFTPNGEWFLIDFQARRHEVTYECCPCCPYIDITYTIHIRRRPLYYMFNLVIPCILLSGITLTVFVLPPEDGKIGLAVTVMLSLVVFLQLVAQTLPPTSDAIPLIVIYFGCIMIMSAGSLALTVVILCYNYRTPDSHSVPPWIREGVNKWLAWMLNMSPPGHETNRYKLAGILSPEEKEILNQKSSRSLLCNVYHAERSLEKLSTKLIARPSYVNDLDNVEQLLTDGTVQLIRKELQVVSKKMCDDEEYEAAIAQWTLARQVVDRLSLFIFAFWNVLSTCVCLLAAPNVFTDAKTRAIEDPTEIIAAVNGTS